MAQASHRFPTLDAMRGLAALSVVALHLRERVQNGRADSLHASLAVDFFFMLSGFVLTLAYQKRLSAGWSTWAFLKVRLIRLYPLYALGLALGMVGAWRLLTLGHHTAGFWTSRVLMAIFLLPALPGMGGPAFLFNGPSWSLCMEVVANIFHGVYLRRGVTAAKMLLAISGVGMIFVLLRFGFVYVGAMSGTVLYGVPRVLFSYSLGVLVFHAWERRTLRPRVSPYLLGLVLLAVLMVPDRLGRGEAWYEVLVLVIVFPWLLLAGAGAELPAKSLGTANFLGLTSYAVYILHEPLLLFWAPLTNRLGWHGAAIGTAWGIPCIVMVFLVAWVADRFYDGPVRAFLQRKLVTDRRAPQTAA